MKHIKINIYGKLILLEILVITLMDFLVPKLSNYPPNSENANFQKLIEPITHNMQYVLLGSLGIILYIIVISFIFKDVFKFLKNKDKKNISFEEIQKVRKSCFSFSKKIIIVQVLVILVILIILFSSMDMELHLILKFLLIYFSFFIVTAIISGIIVRGDLDNILKLTYDISNAYAPIEKNTKFSNELLYNLLPFFVVIVIVISLLGYAKTSEAIGESNYYYYKLYVDEVNTSNIAVDELINDLNMVPLKSPSDYYFIVLKDRTIFSNDAGSLSNFFITYANMFLDKTNGRVYEYYGVEEEGYVKKILLANGEEIYFGFKYSTTSTNLTTYFTSIGIISTIVYTFILVMWSKNTTKNIKEIADKLSTISKQHNISDVYNLPITATNEIGVLTVAFNDIQKSTQKNIETIKSSQSQLIEQERLASLGQMIGGIAHNLKTPIMSISGAAEGIKDLVDEYDASIGNPIVTAQDYHDIAKDMYTWIDKIKSYTEYMSDIITAVKGQAVALANDDETNFTLDELIKRVDILMRHELKNAIVYLNVAMKADPKTVLNGDVNSLVQVINNMISNAIQAYNGEPEKNIDLILKKVDDLLVISIKDYGPGLPEVVKEKLFKEMITTKGKNGTGLGLYMSYSNIKAHFNGNITVDSEAGKGTTFNIILPL